jgi:hypothetical protein
VSLFDAAAAAARCCMCFYSIMLLQQRCSSVWRCCSSLVGVSNAATRDSTMAKREGAKIQIFSRLKLRAKIHSVVEGRSALLQHLEATIRLLPSYRAYLILLYSTLLYSTLLYSTLFLSLASPCQATVSDTAPNTTTMSMSTGMCASLLSERPPTNQPTNQPPPRRAHHHACPTHSHRHHCHSFIVMYTFPTILPRYFHVIASFPRMSGAL